MNNEFPHKEPMDKFFDNLMNDQERSRFLDQMKDDASFGDEQELQSRIDEAIRSRFGQFDSTGDFDVAAIDENAGGTEQVVAASSSVNSISRNRIWMLAIAASLAGVLIYGAVQYLSVDRSPHFSNRPMVAIYHESVEQGFEPYYECHDMERFTNTFKHKQGVKLTLLEMPDDRRMLGISYLGGASRNSIAMLCEALDEPVLVFFDKAANHNEAAVQVETDESLSVFTRKAKDMIFYEVTPHDKPLMLKFIAFVEE